MDPFHGIATAPEWSLTAGRLGGAAVMAAMGSFILAAVFAILTGRDHKWRGASAWLFTLGTLGLATAFGVLVTLFLNNQFQYQYVYNHSSLSTPTEFKVSATWSAQEGSFLLWALLSAGLGLATLRGTGKYFPAYTAIYSVFLAILASILAYETPFKLLTDVVQNGRTLIPPDGDGMTPALQNYWMSIHPPTIFVGFAALTIGFAYAAAAVIHKDPVDYLPRLRPWALFTLAILGLGLCMGGFWAYETQGWGGFWAWDPVENVSFVPWLLLVGLAHGIIVQTTRGKWVVANLWLAGTPFLAFLYGTFLTRSGLLDKVSVHSFASMDKSALMILRIALGAFVLAFIGLMLWRPKALASMVAKREADQPMNREGFYRFGMMMMSLLAAVVTLGMSWPVITAMRGGQGARVEEWLYHQVVIWFFIPTMIAMAIAPFLGWRGEPTRAVWQRMANVVILSIGATAFSFVGFMNPVWGVRASSTDTVGAPFGQTFPLIPLMALLVWLCWFVVISAAWRSIDLARKGSLGIGGYVAHVGLAVLLGGLIVSRGFEKKVTGFVPANGMAALEDDNERATGFVVAYQNFEGKSLYDRDGVVRFNVETPYGYKFEARPGLYYYDQNGEQTAQVWPYIHRLGAHDMYLSLHPPVIDIWETPQLFRVGEERKVDLVTVKYLRPTREGEAGMAGTKFGGIFEITTQEGKFTVNPTITLGDGGMTPSFTPVGEQLFAILGRVDPKDNTAELRLLLQKPIYPVELFYKPMTNLVWIGTAIMTIGGLMAALQRRRRPTRPVVPMPTEPKPEPKEELVDEFIDEPSPEDDRKETSV